MVLPTTYTSVLVLLLLSLFCLGIWPGIFKKTGPQWRFELFYFDFAIGAVLLSLAAAFTFGTLGSEMAFSDRMLVAGRTNEAWAVASGFVFNIGNMMLVAAVSLLGISTAFPLGVGLALIIECCYNFRANNIFLLVGGTVLLLLTIVLGASACHLRDTSSVKASKALQKPAPQSAIRRKTRRTNKGMIIALLSGVPLGLFYPLFTRSVPGDFGLGPYAGVLLFSAGLMLSTIIFNFYFMNIAIEGGAIRFNAYFRGNARQHFLGFAAGAIWAVGAFATATAAFAPSNIEISAQLRVILPLASAFLAVLSGLFIWKEFRRASKSARLSIAITSVLFAGALAVTGIGLAR